MIVRVLRALRARLSTHVRDLVVNGIAASTLAPRSVRRRLYRLSGMDVRTSSISPRCFFGGPRVTVGSRTFVNYGCFFDCLAPIEIGRDCAIGMNAQFVTSTHQKGGPQRRAGPAFGAPIRIADGCWIGAGAIVLPGVSVGKGCVIAAGAVVTGDCPAHGLYAGNPARRIKDLPEDALRETET